MRRPSLVVAIRRLGLGGFSYLVCQMPIMTHSCSHAADAKPNLTHLYTARTASPSTLGSIT
jgi:hypothetical protein